MKNTIRKVFITTVAILIGFTVAFSNASLFSKVSAETTETNYVKPVETIEYGKTSEGDDVMIRSLGVTGENQPGITVTVSKSKVIVHVNAVGSSGTANLYSYDPNDYHSADPLKGLSKATGYSATDIGEYKCGTETTFEFNRYVHGDGYDNMYRKFYLIKDNKILAGPVYASEIESYRDTKPFVTNTKKGLINEDFNTINTAIEMGVGRTVVNVDIGSLIMANEDSKGNPIDNSKKPNAVAFDCNGETFYINSDEINFLDKLIIPYSKAGINVTAVVIVWKQTTYGSSTYPMSMRYDTHNTDTVTLGVNTSNERGADYVAAVMEFLADRYSRSPENGIVDRYCIANEIDYAYDWFLIQPREKGSDGAYHKYDFDIFMEEFSRYFRISNAAIKKYNSNNQAFISLTHNWAESCLESYNENPRTSKRFFAWAPMDILDWMKTHDAKRGDFDWGITVHPYPIGTTSSNPCLTDTNPGNNWKPITGDYKKSPWITAANLELYQQYFDLPENMYKGTEMRRVILTETSICNKIKGTVSDEEYQQSVNEQAATIAMYYYRAASLPCIDEIDYFEENDQPGSYALGLIAHDGTKKPSWTIWKYIDTNLSFQYADRYLHYIAKGRFANATSYRDFMEVVDSGFDWDAYWNEDKIMTRILDNESALPAAISTDKTSYAGGEPIMVTASGNNGDRVGLFKKSDDVSRTEPIYAYSIGVASNGTTCENGNAYDILCYGEISGSRMADASLPAGQYKVVLLNGNNDKVAEFTTTGASNLGSTDYSLTMPKDTFAFGEDVVIRATGPNNGSWVGVYGKNDTYPQVTSIYWYYVNDDAHLSGKPTVVQTQKHERDSLGVGEYKAVLFRDGNYDAVSTLYFSVVATKPEKLTSIKYTLENNTDGFANGLVTINRGNSTATDCVMYWADENGNKLEGFDSLQMFKLTGKVTDHKMVSHSIIPEGAKKLIAYAAFGTQLSDEYVSVDLPADCTYQIEEPNAEFLVISDVHVTTPAGATGEVTLSNTHFAQMLEDVKAISPNSLGIFINGDIANTGIEAEFQMVYSLYNQAVNKGNGTLPKIHMSIGNHDWMQGNPNSQFQKYVKIFNDSIPQPEEVYYTEDVNGMHFVYLGGEQMGLNAVLSQKQLDWFADLMEQFNEEDPDTPVFCFLHQSFYNTVSGSLPGEGWHGVADETKLMNIMMKYDQIVLFNGHSHWHMNSLSNMFPGDENHPVAFNTAAVGYLWNGYDVLSGVYLEGAQGYYVKVYDDKLIFQGRNFDRGNWIPSAMYVAQKQDINTAQKDISVYLNGESQNIYGNGTSTDVNYVSSDKTVAVIKEDGTIVPMSVGSTEVIATAPVTNTTVIARSKFKVSVIGSTLYRIFGDTRYQTSLILADAYKAQMELDQFENVIVASGVNFADALAGSYLSAKKNAPILIVNDANIKNVQNYIKENLKPNGTVYILGGTKAVSSKMESGLSGFKVNRLAGGNRYETNLLILNEAEVWDEDILICTGGNFADSLSGSATGKAILLVNNTLNDAQLSFILGHRSSNYYILGGEKAVTPAVESAINSYVSVERISGGTRYETSTKIAEKFFDEPDTAVFAYSMNFPDGLCAGPLSYALNAPVILTASGKTNYAEAFVRNGHVLKGVVCGGAKLITNGDIKAIYNLDEKTSIVQWVKGKVFE